WPPAFKEWSTKAVRDAFFASPQLPRLLNPEAVADTIARGVGSGHLAYVGKAPNGEYDPFLFKSEIDRANVEISDEMFVINREAAEDYLKAKQAPGVPPPTPGTTVSAPGAGAGPTFVDNGSAEKIGTTTEPSSTPAVITRLLWTGEVPPQKWMN